MPPEKRGCEARTADGDPCGAPPEFMDPETGLCATHDPERSEAVMRGARKGGEAARRLRSKGLDPEELPALDSHEAAEEWADIVGRAVTTGRLGSSRAQACLRAVREWRESRDQGRMSDRLEALTDALAEWKETGDPTPVLEVVD